ncbi:MAG: hypothetical protein CMN60_22095 [Sphingobium sp.]|nr:hypothetical protein [Sphingobium sp.]MBS50324.1 hypothetical protein [Sphingobium sp.]
MKSNGDPRQQWQRGKKMTRRFSPPGQEKVSLAIGPRSLRVAGALYARIIESLLDRTDISASETVSMMTFAVIK